MSCCCCCRALTPPQVQLFAKVVCDEFVVVDISFLILVCESVCVYESTEKVDGYFEPLLMNACCHKKYQKSVFFLFLLNIQTFITLYITFNVIDFQLTRLIPIAKSHGKENLNEEVLLSNMLATNQNWVLSTLKW